MAQHSLTDMKSQGRPRGGALTFPDLQQLLEKQKGQIALALPKHINADRMTRLALTTFTQNTKLLECDAKSIIGSIITASQLGLEIGVQGQGYLVPYKGKCQFIPGWRGIVDLIARAGQASVWTGAVRKGDEFEWCLGDRPMLRHRPGESERVEDITHVYAVGRVNGAEWPVIEVWSIGKVWKHRDKNNKVGDAHYSYAHPEMYARKIPLLQVAKYMPMSVQVRNAIGIADAVDEGRTATINGDFVQVDEDEAPPVQEATAEPVRAAEPDKKPAEAKRPAVTSDDDGDGRVDLD